MIVRQVRTDDLDGLVELAAAADGTMTTMPTTRDGMAERIEEAVKSTAPGSLVDGHEAYLFVLVEGDRLLGMSAIYATVGLERPFYSYKVSSISQSSPDLGIRVDTRLLHLVNDYTGTSVVGTLFLHPDGRGGGRGRTLSLSRFLFMAAHRKRFPDRVMAEMRGFTDSDGGSEFWDAVGRRFFQLEFNDADLRSGHEFRFISDLFPTYPIYADLLPEPAQAVIGRPHPDAVPAAALLEEQGMRNRNYVDIFDAGLCLDAFIDDLEIVRAARSVTLAGEAKENDLDGPLMLVADPTLDSFAVATTRIAETSDQSIELPADVLDETGWAPGIELLISPARRTAGRQGEVAGR